MGGVLTRYRQLETMHVGDQGVAKKEQVFAHEELGMLDGVIRVAELNMDSVMFPTEVHVEKTIDGWLINGILYTKICTDQCHW